jgi:hypothetical protein
MLVLLRSRLRWPEDAGRLLDQFTFDGIAAYVATAPDGEAAARTKAIEYFHVEPTLQFRVVVTKLDKVKERA